MDDREYIGPSQSERPTIGFLVARLGFPVEDMAWNGVLDAARERDANLFIFAGGTWRRSFFEEHDLQRNALYDLVSAERLDGLVIWTASLGYALGLESVSVRNAEIAGLVEQYRSIPTVVWAPVTGEDVTVPVLRAQYGKEIPTLLSHLILFHGDRRIVLLSSAEIQRNLYVQSLAEHRLPLDPDLVVSCDGTPPAGAAAIRQLLDRQVHFDAVIGEDRTLLGVWEVLQARGLRIPDDVHLASIRDTTETRSVIPPITGCRGMEYEQGKQSIGLLFDQLQGKPVPRETLAPLGELVVRRSCGCADAEVMRAAAELSVVGAPSQTPFPGRRGDVPLNVEQEAAAFSKSVNGAWAGRLFESFVAELRGGPAGAFLTALDEALRQTVASGGNVGDLQAAVSTLRRQVVPYLSDERALLKAEDLCQQARVIIGEERRRVLERLGAYTEQQAKTLRDIGQALITMFDLDGLMEVIVGGLPRLGVPSCYVAVYESPGPSSGWARLVLGYREGKRVVLEEGGRRFRCRELVPEGLLPEGRAYSMVVEPLYFQHSQIGFVVFEVGPREGVVYETLRGQMSSALQGALLVREVAERSRALERVNRVLQRRAVQLEASAEVGRAITSIFDVDELLRRTVELLRERFRFERVGVFLLDESGEWLVLRGASGEGMVLEGNRLRVEEGNVVGWTVVHREARVVSDVALGRLEMTLPLRIGERVLGVLSVVSREGAFDGEDVRSLQGVADQVAVALENARQVMDEAALLEATSPLYRASRRLTTAKSTYEVGEAIIASVAETVADGCWVVEFEFTGAGEAEAFVYLGAWRRDREPQYVAGTRLRMEESPLPMEMVSRFWVARDIEEEWLPEGAREVFREAGARAVVNIPLQARGRVIGQVVVLRGTAGEIPEPSLRLYEALSDQGAVALERAQLLEEARRRAEREEQVRGVIERIRRAVDVEQALGVAAEAISHMLDVPYASIELNVGQPR